MSLYPDDIVSLCQCHHVTMPSWVSLNPSECQEFIFFQFTLPTCVRDRMFYVHFSELVSTSELNIYVSLKQTNIYVRLKF